MAQNQDKVSALVMRQHNNISLMDNLGEMVAEKRHSLIHSISSGYYTISSINCLH